MRNVTIPILAIHVLLFVSVFLDVPILRQCVGFVFLTFLPGFVILRALGMKTDSVAVEFSLSVSLSIAFVMFIGLLVNTLYPLFGISAPLSTFPIMITTSALTLAIFTFGRIREIGIDSNACLQLLHARIDNRGVVLCVVSVSLFILSMVGALYHSVFLLISVIAGTAAIIATSIFLFKRVPAWCYTFALFFVSLSLILQISLIYSHIMGWDIFGEYSVYREVQAVGRWYSPGTGMVLHDATNNLRSILSVTILPTAYSNVLNLDGELIFKIIYPFIFCFVPIFLFKAYERQLGKIVALLSAFFFIADPNNFYGLAPLSLAREMITYLFISAVIFCIVEQDIDIKVRRVLIIAFSAALAVSHYSLGFLFAFFIVFVYVAMRIAGRKDQLIDLALVLCIVGITFAWYMYVATPPLNKLTDTFNNIASRLTTDLFNTQSRLDPGMNMLSPTSQAMSINGLIHKIVIYISEFFVVVGAIVLVIKPKEFKFHPVFRWLSICAALLLLVCLAVPNVAPSLNFMRFYQYAMIFLAPLFILGGMYFLGLFKKAVGHYRVRPRFVFRDFRLCLLTTILVVFFLFRSGFVNAVTGDRPYSWSLDFDRMKTSDNFEVRMNLYGVHAPERDLYSARWLALQNKSSSHVYTDSGMGAITLMEYTTLKPESIGLLAGAAPEPGSYIYFRSSSILEDKIAYSQGYLNLSDLSPSPSENCKIYSNGASDVYFVP